MMIMMVSKRYLRILVYEEVGVVLSTSGGSVRSCISRISISFSSSSSNNNDNNNNY